MLIKSYIILGDIYTTKENLFMFQVFVDSAANLPAVTAKKYDIHVVSFVNLVNGKELVCFDPDLSPEEELAKGKEYYNAMRTGCEIKTGLISTANFADAFRTALEADQDVIYLSLSKTSAELITPQDLLPRSFLRNTAENVKSASSIP